MHRSYPLAAHPTRSPRLIPASTVRREKGGAQVTVVALVRSCSALEEPDPTANKVNGEQAHLLQHPPTPREL